MPEFACLMNGEFREIRNFGERPVDIPHKFVQWLPVVREYGDAFTGVEGDNYVIRTVDPSTLPEPVPESVSPRQTRLALLAAGKLDAANAAVAQSDEATKIAWEFATQVNRNDPGVIALAQAIGIDSDALDALFIAAGKI